MVQERANSDHPEGRDGASGQQPRPSYRGDSKRNTATSTRGTYGRRRHRRVDVATIAVLFQHGSPLGRYVVQNLSAGGALLTGGTDVDERDGVRVVLTLPERSPVTLDADVIRRGRGPGGLTAITVKFRHRSPRIEDAIHDAVLAELVRAERAERPAVLVVEDNEELRRRMEASLSGLGRRVRTAASPLEAIRWLEDPDEHIGSAIVDACVGETDGIDFARFLASEYPTLRRVLLQARVRPSRVRIEQARVYFDRLVKDPWDERTLADALEEPVRG